MENSFCTGAYVVTGFIESELSYPWRRMPLGYGKTEGGRCIITILPVSLLPYRQSTLESKVILSPLECEITGAYVR